MFCWAILTFTTTGLEHFEQSLKHPMPIDHLSININPEAGKQWLAEHSYLAEEEQAGLLDLASQLIQHINLDQDRVIGLAGPPGSGKSTLTKLLTFLLQSAGHQAVYLSLDDYYLSRQERQDQHQHSLFITRGVPGTHHLSLLHDHCRDLLQRNITTLEIPVFNKATDQVEGTRTITCPDARPVTVFVEGWCIGIKACDDSEVKHPINMLEQEHDPDAVWRKAVNQYIQTTYRSFFKTLGQCWYLQAPDWSTIVAWRWQQEQELPKPRLQNKNQVADFLAHFQRWVMHMQRQAGQWADLVIRLDAEHHLQEIHAKYEHP